MTSPKRRRADALIARMAKGNLTAEDLSKGLDELLTRAEQQRQDLLYLQASTSSPEAQVVGMTLIERGHIVEQGLDADGWPYQRVLDAVVDGWRIISFPNMALLAVSPDNPHGLGFEFVLERWT